jgi:hypothetical protein
MAQAGTTFRVFVSSTFKDLVQERNRLQERAFKHLQTLCEAQGARFQAIDLRWGISQEASLDQQAIPICIAEVERCQRISPRPNFVVLLGDRYGWRALPAEIPEDEWDEFHPRVTDPDDGALLERWYRRDANAVPAVYVLQAREVELPEHPSEAQVRKARAAEKARWEGTEDSAGTERELRRILLGAIDGLGFSAEQRRRYEKSATEQEIHRGALGAPDAHEHVFCFFRRIVGVPTDGSAGDFYDTRPEDHSDLEALKVELDAHLLSGNVTGYEAQWATSDVSDAHLDGLSDAVESKLWGVISAQLAAMEHEQLAREVAAHRDFGEDRARQFTGRVAILNRLCEYARSGADHPLVVYGVSGSGKSALMAEAATLAGGGDPDAVVVRFIGATPESSDIRRLLDGLCREVSRRYGADEATIPADYRELVEEFPNRLALASADRPLVIFLDALDQLSDAENARSLVWLPRDLPEHVRIVVSTLTEPPECLQVLQAKLPTDHLVELEPMIREEGAELLDKWLADSHRRLQADQRDEVLDKFNQSGLPLYLKFAFEEARRWHEYDPADRTTLTSGIPGIIRENLFARLAADENHGAVMVARSLAYLAAGKNGISEDEMLKVLSASAEVLEEFARRSPESPQFDQLPVVVWSRFYLDLAPYLNTRSADNAALLGFYHRQLREVVEADYLAGEEGRTRHRELARFFADQPFDIEAGTETAPNLRRLSELPYQQTCGELWDDVFGTLTDFEFLEKKAQHVGVIDNGDGTNTYTGVDQLRDDYTLALERMPGGDSSAGTDKRARIIVTGVDLGNGLEIRCPHCHTTSPFQEAWRAEEIDCPHEGCGGPLEVNPFVVGESSLDRR